MNEQYPIHNTMNELIKELVNEKWITTNKLCEVMIKFTNKVLNN